MMAHLTGLRDLSGFLLRESDTSKRGEAHPSPMLQDVWYEDAMNNENVNSTSAPALPDLKALLMAALAGAVLALMLGVIALAALTLTPA